MVEAELLHLMCRWDAGGREIKLKIGDVPVVRGGHAVCIFQPSTPTTKPLTLLIPYFALKMCSFS